MAHNVASKFTYQIRRRTAQVDKTRNQPLTKDTPAWLGDNSGNVFTFNGQTLPTGYVVVRDYHGTLSVAYNNSVPTNTPGIPIWVGYEPNLHPTLFQVLSQRDTYSTNPANPDIPSHHLTHEYPGGDTVNVHGEQFLPALVLGNNGLTLTIYPFFCPKSTGGWVYIPSETLDMTSYVPATGAQAFAICATDSGTIVVVSGNTETTPELIAAADFPSLISTPTDHAICAVRLYTGQTTINQGNALPDIFDLRWLGGGSGGGGGTPAGNEGDIQSNHSGAFYGDDLLARDTNNDFFMGDKTPPTVTADDFHQTANADSPGHLFWLYYGALTPSFTTGGLVAFSAGRGTKASPSALQANDGIGRLKWTGHDGSSWVNSTIGQILGRVSSLGAWSSTNHGFEIDISVTPFNSTTRIIAATIQNDAVVAGKSLVSQSRTLLADTTIQSGSCTVLSEYLDLESYALTLSGDATLLII